MDEETVVKCPLCEYVGDFFEFCGDDDDSEELICPDCDGDVTHIITDEEMKEVEEIAHGQQAKREGGGAIKTRKEIKPKV
jgi:Zn finger protein HypA/HybF involved in hydrogenase expression